jgi:hypothetical protein
LAAPESRCKAIDVVLCDLLVDVSEVVVQIVEVLSNQLLRVVEAASLVIDLPPV